jgi:hypothetical protein
MDKESLEAQQMSEGLRVGIDAQKHKQQMAERIAQHVASIQSKPTKGER